MLRVTGRLWGSQQAQKRVWEHTRLSACVCVWVCEREREREREKERESGCVSNRVVKKGSMSVCMRLYVY